MNSPTGLCTPRPEDIEPVVKAALAEDVGSGDLTAELIPVDQHCAAEVVCRESAVLAGRAWFDTVFALLDRAIDIDWICEDGDEMHVNGVICRLEGPARGIVTGERTALNFLQLLSATATATRRYSAALSGSSTHILDTRKTLPGLRIAQKYAVRCGGGKNHRMGLFDAVLIKENHIAAAGSIEAAVQAVRDSHPGVSIEVEVEDMAELGQALDAGVDMIMVDNFSIDEIKAATDHVQGRAAIEVSGNVELADLRELASTGADYVSIGALTKHVRAIDFSMRIETRDQLRG